jgi:microcystin-dependent protein
MSNPYVGEIRAFGFNFAPYQWASCAGQTLAISQFTALFSIIGTTYGGNGTTTFQLPNLQDMAPMHWGNGAGLTPRTIGQTLGTSNVTVTVPQMPTHNHVMAVAEEKATGQAQGSPSPSAWLGGSVPGATYTNTTSALNAPFSPKAISTNGGSQPHQNLQPLLTLNFCISLYGIFPSRN